MAIKQPNSATVWTEDAGSGAARPIVPVALADDGRGGYTIRALAVGEDPAGRLLADARGGFTVSDGAANPGALAELHFLDVGGTDTSIITYE